MIAVQVPAAGSDTNRTSRPKQGFNGAVVRHDGILVRDGLHAPPCMKTAGRAYVAGWIWSLWMLAKHSEHSHERPHQELHAGAFGLWMAPSHLQISPSHRCWRFA